MPKYDEVGNVKQIKMYDDYGRESGWVDYTIQVDILPEVFYGYQRVSLYMAASCGGRTAEIQPLLILAVEPFQISRTV